MAVARKSDVSATGSWFQTVITSRRNRRSTTLGRPVRSVPVGSQVSVTDTLQRRELSPEHPRAPQPPHKQQMEHSPPRRGNVPRQTSIRKPSRTVSPSTQVSSEETLPSIPVMPNSETVPLWLMRLYTVHRYSSIAVFLLVTVTLMIYGWTVYSQQLWSQAYRKLQDLQHHERQLATTNEILKEKMAQEAQRPVTGLVSPSPKGTIFLNPAPVGSKQILPNTAQNSETQQETANPLGY